MRKKLIILLSLLGVSKVWGAEVKCSVRTLQSVCGSGKIELNLDFDEMTFKLTNGDVGCWISDIIHTGKIVLTDNPTRGYNSRSYDLKADALFPDSFDGTRREISPIVLAAVEISTQKYLQNAAYLQYREGVNQNRGRVDATYLSCKRELPVINRPLDPPTSRDYCFEICNRSCQEQPVFCGQW